MSTSPIFDSSYAMDFQPSPFTYSKNSFPDLRAFYKERLKRQANGKLTLR